MNQQSPTAIRGKCDKNADCNTSDGALLAQFKAGNEGAFRALVDRYTPPIYNLAFCFLRDPMEAENVTQECFLRVIGALDRLRLDTPFKPYLFRVAVNLCRDLARKKRPLLFTDLNNASERYDGAEAAEASEAIEDGAAPPWQRVLDEELRERLHVAIDCLPAIYQAVVTLRYMEEFSYEEIAQALNLPVNTVRTHLHRAKNHLRKKLEHDLKVRRSPDAMPPDAVSLSMLRLSFKAV